MSSNNVVRPFKIAVSDAKLQNLKSKLSCTTFPDELDFTDDWKYGVPLKEVKRLTAYWQHGYDWRENEARLNQETSQYMIDIDVDGFGDVGIHFVHHRSEKAAAIPLLFVHGWPGGFWEALKMLPLLTNATTDGPSFHVVVPSLPNFGFSQATRQPGFGISQYAEVLHKLMQKLGYEKYATQGGDWGFVITRSMGLTYKSHILASHLNMILVRAPPKFTKHPLLYLQSLLPLSAAETAGLQRMQQFAAEGTGYSKLQTTKPHTLGFALADSPVALLAWVYEKLHDWTDGYPWTDDEILTWVSLYQFSRAGPDASVRIYYEAVHATDHRTLATTQYNGAVKLGLSYFPKDAMHESGGHFAAYEAPDALAADLRKMFSKPGLAKI